MKLFRVECRGGFCRVALTERGVRFLDHPNAEIWCCARTQPTLAALSGRQLHLDGCMRVAELVHSHTYAAARFPQGSQQLLASLFGVATGRKLKRKRARKQTTT